MNILLLTNASPAAVVSPGGAETSIRLLAERLAGRAHVVVYASKKPSWFPFAREISPLNGGVRHIVVRTLRGRGRSRGLNAAHKALFTHELERVVKRHDIQVAYCFYEMENVAALLRVRARLGRPSVVLRMAGLRWSVGCTRDPSLIPEYERSFNEVDAVNFIHEDLERMVEQKLTEHGMSVHFKRRIIGDIGSSVNVAPRRQRDRQPDAPFRIVMVARFSDYQKRQDLLVEAAAMVDPQLPISIELIGRGNQREAIEARIATLGQGARVSVNHGMSQEALWARMREADLMCHACDFEGLGKVIIEAMALGLPVLASNVAPLNRLIADGENGFLVDNDPRAWARRIEELARADAAMARVSEQAIAFARHHYDASINVELYEAAFAALAPERG